MTSLFRLCFFILSVVPPRWAYRLSRATARILLRLNAEAARTTAINLAVCFPGQSAEARRKLTLDSLTHMVLFAFEFGYLINWPTSKILSTLKRVEGREVLDEAWRDDRGILVLLPHFGHFELISVFLGEHYSLAALYDPPRIKSLDPVISDARERHGGQMYPISPAGLRGILKVIKSGGLALLLPDQVPGRQAGGVASTFFGQPALTMSLSYRLAEASDAHVLVASLRRHVEPTGVTHTLRFSRLEPSEPGEQGHVDAVNRAIEAVVELAPEQYQWEYKRFRRSLGADSQNIYRRQ